MASDAVLDVRGLSPRQLTAFAARYDILARENLEALAHLKTDPVRGQIDGAISRILGIPDVVFIRELLDREPGLSAIEIAPREAVAEEDEDGDDTQAEMELSVDSSSKNKKRR